MNGLEDSSMMQFKQARKPPANASATWWAQRIVRMRGRSSRPVVCPYCEQEIIAGQPYHVAWSGVYGAHAECVKLALLAQAAGGQGVVR